MNDLLPSSSVPFILSHGIIFLVRANSDRDALGRVQKAFQHNRIICRLEFYFATVSRGNFGKKKGCQQHWNT
jgi:thioester reductase-like protein